MRTFKFLIIVLFCLMATTAQALIKDSEWWANFVAQGNSHNYSRLIYFFQAEPRFGNQQGIFNEAYLGGGLGYRILDHMQAFIIYLYVPSITEDTGAVNHENRLLQRISGDKALSHHLLLRYRSQLEQRWLVGQPGVAWRARQRVTLLFLRRLSHRVSPFIADEVFFNLNHTPWVTPRTFSQNRFFVGVEIPLRHNVVVDLAYLNRFARLQTENLIDQIIFMSVFWRFR